MERKRAREAAGAAEGAALETRGLQKLVVSRPKRARKAKSASASKSSSKTRTSTASRRASPAAAIVLSPKRQAAGVRLAAMLKKAVVARKIDEQAQDMKLVLQNMRTQLVKEGPRAGRGMRQQRRLMDELLEENAGALAVDELSQILRSAEKYVSSRESASGLSADEARAVKQDVAMASLVFQGRANRRMNSKERARLESLARKLGPVAVRSGETGSAAARRIVALFGPNLGADTVRQRLRSFLGSSALKELDGVLASASRHASSLAGEQVLSASRSSEIARRAAAAYVRAQPAAGSRSGDEAEAGTSTRSFIAASVGSQRTARTATRTSSASARSQTRSSQRSKIVTPEVPLALARGRRAGVRAPERYGVAEAALLEMTEITKRFAKAYKAARKAAGSKSRGRHEREMHDAKVELVMHMLQSLPGHLDAEQRRELDKMINTVFAGKDKAARLEAIELFAHKSAASALMRSEDKRRLRDLLARLMTVSELGSLQNEFDWMSSVSTRSKTPTPHKSRSRRIVLSDKRLMDLVDAAAVQRRKKKLGGGRVLVFRKKK